MGGTKLPSSSRAAVARIAPPWPKLPAPPEDVPDHAGEIQASGCFTDIKVRRYVWETRYSAEQYIDLLNTFSGHIAMEPVKREHLYAEIRRRLADRRVRRHWYAILHVARGRARRSYRNA